MSYEQTSMKVIFLLYFNILESKTKAFRSLKRMSSNQLNKLPKSKSA